MAENVTIQFNIEGNFATQIKDYAKAINNANKVVKSLSQSFIKLQEIAKNGFNADNIITSLKNVEKVFKGFHNIKGEDLQRSIATLDPTRLREFSASLTVFQQVLTTDLIGRIASFSNSLVGLSVAQKALDSTVLVQQITALSDALPKLKQAVTSDNFKNFAADLKSLHVDTQNIQGIIKLGSALKAITNFGSSKTALTDLAAGIKSLGRIKETSGFTRNVENIVKAGAMLSKMEPIDFSKITNGLKDLTRVDLKKEEWDKVQGVAGQIKKAFEELKTVKIPNLVGFHEGVTLLNDSGAKLSDPHGLKANVAEIKLVLDQLSKVKMPNLGNLVKNLGKLSEENYDFDKIGKSVQSFKNTLGQLHGIQIPSLSGFAKGLVELKGVSGSEIQSIANTLKGVPESLAGWDKVKTPDLASFAKGLKELGSGTIDFKQVNENLKSLPNRLKKLGEIQAPDLSKFSKGLIDLSKPAVSAVKSAHAIDKVLEVLSKYKDAQLRVPSLANFAKGLRELSSFEGEIESLRNKSKIIKTFLNEFREFGGLQLPNVQGIVSAIHKLSTAVPENAGITAAKHINDITASIKGLDGVSAPNLTSLTKAFSVLSNTNFEGLKTTNFRQNVGEIKWAIEELNKLGGKNLPNFKNLSDAFKDLSGDKAKGLNLLYFRNNVEEIKAAIAKLQEVKGTKFPDLKNIAEGFRTLDTIVPKGQEIGNIGAFTHNIEQIRQGLVTLSSLHKTSLPNLKNIAEGFRSLDDIVPKGRSTTDIGAFTHNIEQIRQGLVALSEFRKISLPNLKEVAQGFRELDQWLPKGKLSSDIGAFQANIDRIRTALSTLSGFNKVSLPNLKGMADGFRSIDEVLPKGKLGADIGRFEENIQRIKNALEVFRNFNVSIPNIKGLSEGFRKLDEALPKGKLGEDIGKFENNIQRIKNTLETFRNFNIPIPSIKGLADGFRSLDESLPKGKLSADIGKFEENVRKIKNALEVFKHLNVSVPNIKGLADGFRSLDEALPKGKSSADVGKFEENVRHIATTVGIFNNIPPVKPGGMPNLKNIADAFVILSSDKITSADTTRFRNSVEQIKQSIHSLAEVQNIRIPNLKNVTSGFKDLTEDRLKGLGNLNFSYNIEKIKDAVKSLAEVQHIQIPNLKNLAQGFRELDNVIPKGKSNADIGKFQLNIDAIRDNVLKLKEVSNIRLPNIKNLAEGFKILNELPVKYGFNEAGSKYGSRIKLAAEEIKTAFADFDKIRLPNLKNLADGFNSLNNVFKSKDVVETGKFGERIKQIKDAATDLNVLGKLRLPSLNSLAQGFKVLDSIPKNASNEPAINNFKTNIGKIKEATEELVGLSKIKLPNLKNIADGFRSLDVAIPKGQDATNIGKFKDNVDAIKNAVAGLDKIKLPNLKNIADGFKALNEATVKYKFDSNAKYVSQIKLVVDEIKTAFAGFNNIQLPNVKNVADGFRILNELPIKNNDAGHANLTANIHKLKQALSQLKDLDGTAFPNVKSISEGMQNLTKLGPIAQNLDATFQTVANALQHVHGIKVPKLKDFTDGFEQLKTIVSKSTGTMETSKFAQDMTALSTALSGFGKVSLPPNLSGFAKGIEAITKVNVELFSKRFNELMVAINSFKIDTNNAALNHFTAVLTLASSAIQQINSQLNQAQSQFGSFGRSVDQVTNPLDKLSERIKMFLQYRVISTVFNNFTNWLQSVPEQIREFEKAMYNVQSITGATNSTIAQLGLTVKDIASTTKFSAAEVADGMTMIAQAGFSAGQSMQMMQSISNLATGTLTDMKTTVDLVTSAMVVFNIEAHNASRVSDVFANAVNKSKLTMDKIKTAFNYIGPVARDAGVSFEETAVSMMLLANSGQKASTIGTGLRNVFSTLLSPSKKLTEAANAAGVALVDLDPRVNSMKTVIENLSLVVRDSSVALDVFGKRGSTAVLSLTNGLKDYDRLINSVQRVGSAADMASKQQEGLYVRWKNMHDRAQLVAVTLGENGLTGVFGALIDKFSAFLNAINKANESIGGRILIKATMLSTAFATFGITLAGIIKFFPMLWSGIKAGNVALATMATRLLGVKTAANAAGASMKALTALSMNVGIIAAFTALSLAISYVVEKTKELENAIKDAAVEIGRIKGQISAFDDASEIFNRAQAGTEEYANAIRTVMAAFEENKGAVKGAEDEYTALKESIDAVNGRFRDGGEALQRYGEKLKQLEIEKISQQLSNLYKQFDKVQNKASMFTEEGRDRSMRVVDVREWDAGGVSGVEVVRATDYAKSMELLEQIRAKAVDVKEIFQSSWFGNSAEQNFAEWRDGLQQLTEGAINLLDVLHKAGKIDFTMPEESIRKLLLALGKTRDEIEATMYHFKQMQKAEFDGMFMKAIGPSLADDLRRVAGEAANVDKLYKQIGETIDATGKTSVNLSNAFASVKDNVEKATAELQKVSVNVNITEEDKQAVANILNSYLELYNELEVAKEQHEAKIKAIEERNDLSDHQKILHRKEAEAELNTIRERFAERASALLKERNANENVAMLYRASIYNAEVREAILAEEKKIDAARKRCAKILGIQEQELKDKNSKELASIKEWTDAQKQALNTWERSLTEHEQSMAALAERMSKKMNDALRSPESAEAFTAERLKAFKIIEKRADSSLQHELNNIRKLEELYIQTNGKLGVTFKEARQMEQNAVHKTYQELTAALSGYIEELKKKYPYSYKEVIQPIQDKIVEITAKSEETQINLKDKNIKKEMALRGAAAKQIENISKEMHAAIKREQEKAMHDIAVLEAKGIMTHEQAEQSKAEASIKYLQASIRAAEEQYKVLSQDPQMVAENAQMLQQLVQDIEKNQEEITKIRRKGIEDQTKIITEGHKKLAEIEGKVGAGAFSAKEQAKITANYEREFEKRKRLGEENAKALAEAETKPLDKVTQEVQKHAAKRMEIQSKTTEKIASLEKELAQKQEDFERKKLDIIKKYNAKRRDLQTSLQDKLHNIETSDMSGERKEKADIDYARTKRSRAMSSMNEAIRSGDSQALDRIYKELESAMGAFEGASKPKEYKSEILGIYNALQKIIDAQEQIEKQEAERKNNQEVDALTKKIQTANDAMEKSLAVESERHTKTMGNLEREANKIREQIALAEKLRDTYINSMSSDGTVPSTQIPKGGPQSRIPVNPGTFNGQVEALGNIPELDSLIKQLQAVQDISVKSATAFKESWASAMSDFVNDSVNKTELWYKDAQGVAQRLTAEQAEIFRQNTDAWIESNGKVYQSYNDVATGANALAGTALETWKRAFDGASTAATTKAQESADAVTEALIKAAGPAGQVLAQSIGEGAVKGGQNVQTAFQNLAPALAQVTNGLSLNISNDMVQGATDGIDRTKAVLPQLTTWVDKETGRTWYQWGQGLADATQNGVNQAKAATDAYRKVVLEDGRVLYTNLTEAQRQGYADMAAAVKAAASGISTEYETLYTRTTIAGKDFYRAITQEEAKAIAHKEANALKENELFVKTTERNLEIFQDMSTKMTIGDWAEKFKTAEAEKAAYATAKKAMGTWTSTVQESEPAYVSVELAEATLNKAETEVEATKLKIAEKAAEFSVKVHDGSVSEVRAKAEQLIAMIENNNAEILIDLDEKGKQQAISEVKNLVKELETKETVMLEAEADKKKLDEVNDTIKKLTEDISKKQQILLKPNLDETEKRKILSDIEKLTNDAKDKLSKLQVELHDEEAKKQIAQIIAMLDKIPKETKTKIGVQVNEAIRDIDAVIRKLNSIPKTITTVHKIVTREEKAAGGLVGAYATGGRVRRPEEPEQYADGGQTFRRLPSRYISRGSGHKDDVPALLMKNEFVHRAAAVKKYGLNFMYKLNNLEIPTSITKMFADGGLVSNAVTSIQKFATGGLVKSARRKLEDMFSGSGVNLNVDNLNVVGKIEQAADSITSPVGVQALHTIAKSIEANVARFAEGGPLTSTVLTSRQMSEISGKYHTIIAQARQEGNTAIAKALSEEQANLAKLASALKGNLDNINITYNKQVQKLTEAHNKRVSEKEAEYKSNVNSENESYSKRVNSDNKAYAKEDEEYNKSIAQLKSDYEKELEELEKALKDKKETARKEEEREAKEEAKTQKSYKKEDKRYAKETADRKKSHDDELAAAKKEYEDAQFKYEAELEQKKQEVDAKKSEIENFKNQMASRKFPANSKKIREASVEEVMEAHIAQTKSENKGDDYIYAIDLGGLVKAEDNKGEPPTDAEIQRLYKAIRPYTETERRHRDKLTTIAYNPPYSRQALEQLEKYNNDLNELTGYNAYKRALKAKKLGVSIANIENADKEPSKPRQSKPYREYLNSHYMTDYKQPYAQAQRDLDEFLKADSPKTTYDKRVAELKQAYNEAKKEAEEARAEVMEQRKEHAEQLAETRANRAEELRQAQIDYNEGIAAAKEKYNTDLSEAEENRRVSLEERKTAIAERDKEHKDNLESYKKDYDNTVSEATASYNEDMASAKESYDSEVSSARSQYSNDVASLRETTQNNVNSAKESMNSSISRAQSDMQEEFKSQEDAARTALAEKKDTYSTTRKEAEEALVDSIEHPSTTVAAQESVEKATEKMSEDAVLQKYGMNIEELIRRLSKGLWKFATGGLVPSTVTSKPNTDSVLSLLMPNEFVMSAKAVRTFGTDFMNSINNLRLPAFAVGGIVESGSTQGTTRSFKAGEMAVNKTIHALDLTINNTHIGELVGERNVIDRFIGEMQRARMGLGATA